jgi:hypothetical protein
MWNRHRAQPATTSAERRATVVRDEIARLRRQLVDEDELTAALAQFDPVFPLPSVYSTRSPAFHY